MAGEMRERDERRTIAPPTHIAPSVVMAGTRTAASRRGMFVAATLLAMLLLVLMPFGVSANKHKVRRCGRRPRFVHSLTARRVTAASLPRPLPIL